MLDQYMCMLPVGAIVGAEDDGHCHLGRLRIAMVGVRNEKVPPCTMGSLSEAREFEHKLVIMKFKQNLT